ncbi:MAG TPA: hypothetical protein VHE34_24215 [Puia sp.]|uniref:hypothetical protein n=1 Tax=Puia sp. TaxID=2045100 RepID=UPI002C19DB2E|nr:hypothetical protein [Puia sp.]HVU98360.1 hypothetical protein [Puia sp.]
MNPKWLLTLALAVLAAMLTSCGASKNLTGAYRSKFAIGGFFTTDIRLNADSTLQYVVQGDLQYEKATGHYRVFGKKLYILFDKEKPDSEMPYHQFDVMPVKQDTVDGNRIDYQKFLYIGHNKLFPAQVKTGKKLTRNTGYSKRRKYFFWGSHYYKRRYYYYKKKPPANPQKH